MRNANGANVLFLDFFLMTLFLCMHAKGEEQQGEIAQKNWYEQVHGGKQVLQRVQHKRSEEKEKRILNKL